MSLPVNAFYWEGLVLGLGLFAAPGPKDTLIIRQSVSGGAVWNAVAICVVADVVLIAVGVAGLGSVLSDTPQAVSVLLFLGGAYLLWFGASRLHAAISNRSMPGLTEPRRTSRQVAMEAISLGFANPYAWLDTVVLIGTMGGTKPPLQQTAFAAGAMTASLLWFMSLAAGSRRLTCLFKSAVAWRVLDIGVALLMFGLAASVLWELVRTHP